MTSRSDLARVIRAIAEGAPIDWDAVERTPSDPSVSPVLEELKVISRISEVHGAVGSSSAPNSAQDDIGCWGSLTILECVGRGSYGAVYRAWDSRLDREVALKLLAPHASEGTADIPAIEEGRLLAKVRHPNIVTVYGADRIDGRVGIWMEFVKGRTLADVVRSNGPLDASEIARIGIEVARGLAAVHRAGVLHRDVKSQNVILQDDGRVVLMDFGSGRAADDERTTNAGTPLYLAPELIRGETATPCSDVYSVGILLYHLATALFPVEGASLKDLRDAHARGDRQTLRARRPDLPARLATLIDRACNPDPASRFPTAAGLESALQRAADRGRVRAVALATVASMVLIAAFLGAARAMRPASPTPPRTETDPLETVAVHSVTAGRLYKQSLHWARQRNWQTAVEPARLAVIEDPSFASGWIWAAWTIRNAALGALPLDSDDKAKQAVEREYAPYVLKAVALAPSAPEWEKHWILGSAAMFSGDDRAAVQHMAAVYAANQLDYSYNNLVNLAERITRRARTPREAEEGIAQVTAALPPDQWAKCCQWIAWAPAYKFWHADDVDAVQERVDRALHDLQLRRHAAAPPAAYFALALGRLTDAETLFRYAEYGAAEDARQLDLLVVAEARGDENEVRRLAEMLPRRGVFVRPSRLLRAGYLHEAEELLQTPVPAINLGQPLQPLFDVAHGQLQVLRGQFDDAVPFLRSGMRGLADSRFREYYDGCAALAAAYRGREQFSRAVDVLEECTVNRPSYSPRLLFRGVWQWMELRLDLADAYRAAGRVSEAQHIEDGLRHSLKYADSDAPLVTRLGTRADARGRLSASSHFPPQRH